MRTGPNQGAGAGEIEQNVSEQNRGTCPQTTRHGNVRINRVFVKRIGECVEVSDKGL